MADTKFMGVDRGTLTTVGVIVAICAPALTMIVTVIGLFSMMNASINRLDANITALSARVKARGEALAAHGADIATLRSDFQEMRSEVRTIGADIVEMKLDIVQINGRFENIERRLPDFDLVDDRLDDLERSHARLNERFDELADAGGE